VTPLVVAFAGGLARSLHCAGICGGLAALLGGGGMRLGPYPDGVDALAGIPPHAA
jgi:hypothetical protein